MTHLVKYWINEDVSSSFVCQTKCSLFLCCCFLNVSFSWSQLSWHLSVQKALCVYFSQKKEEKKTLSGSFNSFKRISSCSNLDKPQQNRIVSDLNAPLLFVSVHEGALEDLDRAISLSGGRGRTACHGLVQRGLLRRLAGQDDDAREDFEKAAELGSEFARQQAVALNPYAALCNKMLSEVMGKLRNPSVWHAINLFLKKNKKKWVKPRSGLCCMVYS